MTAALEPQALLKRPLMSRYTLAVRIVTERLRGVPYETTAREVNRLVFDCYPWGKRRGHPYNAWRKAVRAVQDERAKVCRWNGDPKAAQHAAALRRPS